MKPYLLDLYVASSKEKYQMPAWPIRLYLSIFEPPLGKTLRLDLVHALLRQYPRDLKGKRLLDVGCGIGDLAFTLAAQGANVVGVELSAEKVEVANRIARKWGYSEEQLKFIAGDVTKLQEMNLGKFDGIFCLAILEHVKEDVSTLEQMHALLDQDGFLIVEVPSATRKTIPEVEAEDGHVRPGYYFNKMPEQLAQTGFRVLAGKTMDSLGLAYWWCKISRILPGRSARGKFFILLSPLFIPLIRLTSAFVKRPGYELCFYALKEQVPVKAIPQEYSPVVVSSTAEQTANLA